VEDERVKSFISFSGGVESTTLALLFGHLATLVTVDLGWEHKAMYAHWVKVLNRLREVHGSGVVLEVLKPQETLPETIRRKRFFPSPRFRYCTPKKIAEVDAFLRSQGACELMIGLNYDERGERTGNHGLLANVRYTYPLVDLRLRRDGCVRLLREYDLLPPQEPYMSRGGCMGCFFKRKQEFRAMVHLVPEEIESVAELEADVQDRRVKHYGVRDGIPNMRDFIAGERAQGTLFTPESLYVASDESAPAAAPCGVFCHR
jgi:hypothetical protein